MADNRKLVATQWSWPATDTSTVQQTVPVATAATIPEQTPSVISQAQTPSEQSNSWIQANQGITSWYLNLWGGKIVNKESQQYKALVAAWYDDNKIINMYNSKKNALTPEKAQEPSVEAKPQETSKIVSPTQQTNTTTTPIAVDPNKDDSEARQQEIVNNLNQYKQANPGLFADKELFKKSFSYDNRSLLQKQILDNRYGNNVEKVQQTTSLLRQPISSIVSQYTNGTISDTDISNMQNIDPVRYADIQAAIEQNKKNEEYKKELYGDDTKNNEDTGLNAILNKVNTLLESKSDSSMYEDYKNQINSPEMTTLKDDLSAKEGEVKEIDNEINSTKSELEKKFKWSGISQGQINALLQDQTQLLQNKKNSLSIEYQTLADKYNNKLSTIKDTLDITEKENAQKNQQEAMQFQKLWFLYNVYSDQQKRQDAIKMADVQYQRDVEKMQKQFEQSKEMTKFQDQIQNGDINSSDPYMFNKAIEKNVDGLMKQFDGLITSSRDQLTERVKDGMKSGKSYSAVLGDIMNDIRNKPEYKAWQSNKIGIDTKPFSVTDTMLWWKNADGTITYQNKADFDTAHSPTAIDQIKTSVDQERQLNWSSQYDNTAFVQQLKDKYKVNNGVWVDCGTQCGGFANQAYSEQWVTLWMGSSFESKISSLSKPWIYSPIPIIGGAVALDTGATYTDASGKKVNAGHAGIITEIDTKNNRIKVLNSNYNGTGDKPDNRVTENWFPISQAKAFWTAPWKASPTELASNNSSFTPSDEAMFKDWLNTGLPKTATADQKKKYDSRYNQTKPLNKTQESQVQSIYNSFDTEQTVKNFQIAQQWYKFTQGLDNNTNNPSDDIGLIYALAKAMDPTSAVREWEYSTVQKYNQSWADSFWFDAKRTFSNTVFLTPESRANIKKTISNQYNTIKGSYDNVYNEYGRRIDKTTGRNDGLSYLTQYANGSSNPVLDINSFLPWSWAGTMAPSINNTYDSELPY